MTMVRSFSLLIVAMAALGGAWKLAAQEPEPTERRAAAEKAQREGNFRDAYDAYRILCLDPAANGKTAIDDFEHALTCLQQLQRLHDIDEFREAVAEKHSDDWRILNAVGRSYRTISHEGFIVADKFHRGYHDQGGRYVSASERDRVRGLQLYAAAARLAADDKIAGETAKFYKDYADAWLNSREYGEAWKLQTLTDLSQLPDYDDAQRWGRRGWGGGGGKGAPVDGDGNPIYYGIPESFEVARNDGERWRWCLEHTVTLEAGYRTGVDWEFANFLHSQFGVQTLQQANIILPSANDKDDDNNDPRANIWSLHSLEDSETIARLATGPKRFNLPDEFNPLVLYKKVAGGDPGSGHAKLAQDTLASIYLDRQQYVKAAEAWKTAIDKFGTDEGRRTQQLDQIIKPWGAFESVADQPSGEGANVDFRFRNGKKVSLEAHAIHIDALLNDIKARLKSNSKEFTWNDLQIDQIGRRLVEDDEKKYLGDRVAQWSVDLEPRPEHFDRRITITTPLQKAGAYFVVATMEDGNTSRVVLWVDDTAIVKKPLAERALYYVADAVSGAPLPNVNVEFFGWRHEFFNENKSHRILTKNFAEKTNADGQVMPDPKLLDNQYQWIAIARDGKRLAHLGFTNVWYPGIQSMRMDQTKVVVITDRPVYRPDQKVNFKFWVRPAKYDLTPEESKAFANQTYTIQLSDPMGTEVWKKPFTTDAYGGFVGEHALPKDAKLGTYSLNIVDHPNIGGGGTFRCEEYKKPEYTVSVEAPERPVALGEKVEATIKATYLFGAPVTNATVKYRVERTPHTQRWFPSSRWDWLYGSGYWWFGSDDTWYPGFARWGCFAPRPFWFPWNPEPPELVLDAEAPIGEDGTLKIEIDTALAKVLHGDEDHSYKITAEVVDASRRTIVGEGNVLVARDPFKVFVWLDRGYYNVGDTLKANVQVRTLDGKPVGGKGKLTLYKVTYNDTGKPDEAIAGEWEINPDEQGSLTQEIKASEAGQYRVSYTLTHEEPEHEPATREGAYLFVIRGQGFDGSKFQFDDLELIPDKKEYAPGEQVNLLINTDRVKSTVLLFLRPANGVYPEKPQMLRLNGKSVSVPVGVAQGDMPNFFVEAVTIANGKVHTVLKSIAVPPVSRVLNVDVTPSASTYKPGEKAEVEVKLTELNGEPFQGSIVMSIYDKAVEYISGGSNVPDLREHFWKWRRDHYSNTEHSLAHVGHNLLKPDEIGMAYLGAFGAMVADFDEKAARFDIASDAMPAAPKAAMARSRGGMGGGGGFFGDALASAEMAGGEAPLVEPTVRTQFADTAYWNGAITTDDQGHAKIDLTMPENLTGWKIRAWAMGEGTRVGEATKEVTTSKNLLVRLQAPRFFVEKDEVVISAIVHNYLPHEKNAVVDMELEGETLNPMDAASGGRQPPVDSKSSDESNGRLTPTARQIVIAANGEARVEWRVKAIKEGEAKITVKALTDEESDAMQMTFPVYVHGMLKTESFTGVVRPNEEAGKLTIKVPAERRPEQSLLEIRYSPTLAGAMVDALPYLVDYPYGCTEQTLNRFLPTVMTQNILKRMNLDLAAIRDKRTNLNPQEIGDDAARAADWARITKAWHREMKNPVFDEAEVERMVKQGVADLTAMQLSDGGWGWFSGFGEHSWPHTTCVVVHGLQLAEANGVALVPEVKQRGIDWLKRYQDEQVQLLQTGEKVEKKEIKPEPGLHYRTSAADLDAFVYMVLVDADVANAEMQRFLYRDRTKLSLYSAAMFGLALDKQKQIEQRDMVIKNIDQFVVTDNENQTTYIDLPNVGNYWWHWYGDTIEANAYYLKLLTRVNPQDSKAAGLVKYLLNNRRHSTYWKSTRDTAICIEAMAEYFIASGESQPNMLVEVWIDGEKKQSVEITPEVLFTFNNKFIIAGTDLKDGEHTIELRKLPLGAPPASGGRQSPVKPDKEPGSLYYNAYLTNFTLEDPITAAGLEIKVGRKFYKLVQRENATDLVEGGRGQAIDQKALKYDRYELASLDEVASGDLIEIELEIDSKNDYEYVIFEDYKAAGCEPVELQSGYTRDGLGAYVEFRDERVAFFLRELSRGKHSVSYRMRAETPGQFSALPTAAHAMYAPELKANSDEMKLKIADE
jgi:uncharacterized protein YfaS (alpha-2-macroglobulin family)